MFTVGDRLERFMLVDSLRLDSVDTVYVLVKTEADLVTLARAWYPLVDWYFENVDEAHDDEGFAMYGPVRTPRGLVIALSDFLTPSVCLQRFVGLLNRTELVGELDLFPEEESVRLAEDQIACRIDLKADVFVALGGDVFPLPPGDVRDGVRGLPRWTLAQSRRDQIIDFMATWCRLEGAARLYLRAC